MTTAGLSITETYTPLKAFPLNKFVAYPTRQSLPAVWMRSGTSKGLFIHRKDLPESVGLWGPILLSAMGSSNGNGRQLDGVGGATSTTSKVAVVAKSNRPGIDVDYTFIQVAPDQAKIDMTGNCGNIASGVGPFSVDEGLVRAKIGQTEIDVRIFNTNTGQSIVETIQLSPDGTCKEHGTCQIHGVAGTSSPIKVAFLNPEGSMTGKMFPSGATQEILTVQTRKVGKLQVQVSLVDAANPFVLVDSHSLKLNGHCTWPGLATDVESASVVQGTPKIAFLSPPTDESSDLDVLAFTMGRLHTSLQLTGAVCIGVAMTMYGTVAWRLASGGVANKPPKHGMEVEGNKIASAIPMGIRHPAGVIQAEAVLDLARDGTIQVKQVAIIRTARRLFEGNVFFKA
ncbi:FAD-linked sulfhydryl oxidase ERV2 [Penicillium atrosanguineum]|uniref:FAD-linked sulfhydryl oxidase ERV2 n=1 Tax=Penicillium atrosanguineum TaxID=1132637 RepID=UPI00238950C1|nr:FAD-linked sulfhydryl oxidase ERV2 [Penicillium atrosanguineum]KAJ5314052.1 FAD-linked sulfhydryl oxidase ERV2 [Penicillium atrosanguineum]